VSRKSLVSDLRALLPFGERSPLSRDDGGDRGPAAVGDEVAMSAFDLLDELMRAKEPK
jgi:hypothetical protein